MNEFALTPALAHTYYTFRVHGRLYGVDLAQVREVSAQVASTPVPQAPPLVRGLANLRSRIYLVLDTGAAVRSAPSEQTADSRLIVLQERVAEGVALFADRGGDVVRVSTDQIEAAADSDAVDSPGGSSASPVVALCKLDGELMMAIDPVRIVAALETAIR
jgi:purine-binding chemotaxis protein CheW